MLPQISNIPRQSNMVIDSFRGINVTPSYKSGEFTECSNVDLTSYPALSSRKKRGLKDSCDGTINGVGNCNGFFYTYYKENPKSIYISYNGTDYEYTSYTRSGDYSAKRKFAGLENSILIIPDNVIFYIETLSFKQINISQSINYETANKKFAQESHNDDAYKADANTAIGSIYHNKLVSKSTNYVPGSSVVYKFYPVAFDPKIEVGDVITIKMKAYSPTTEASDEYSNLMSRFKEGIVLKVKDIEKVKHDIVYGESISENIALIFENDSINTGKYDDLCFSEIQIEKKIPNLEAITSFNNRIWGIEGNKIHTSKLGDADEWNDFSVDSYGTLPSSCFSSSAGTDGEFTAIIPHGNYIYALKENYIHKVYGDTPDEFAITNLKAPGCIKGKETLATCGAYLVYASVDGIYAVKDGYPNLVSRKIGDVNPVCAAALGDKYYMICQNDDGRVIYVYDIKYDNWVMQTCPDNADNLCSDSQNICFSAGESLIYITESDDTREYEKDVRWNFRLRFDENDFLKNTAIRALAGITLSQNASFTVRAIYDDDTRGAICGFCYDETQNGSCLMRLPLKRDLGFYLDFRGVGGFVLRNIKFNYYKSSDE